MSEENERLYEEAQRRLREITTLYEASQACLSISDQEGLLTAIIEAAVRATDAALGSVMLIDEGKGEYIFGAHYGLSQETIAAIEAELHIPLGEGLVGAVVTTGQPVMVADVTMDPRWIPMGTKEPMRSFLGVPLVGRDRQPLGALNLARPEVGAFDEGHARLLSTFANQAALATENAWLYEQAQQEIAERKRTEEALRESEERFRSIFENAVMGLYRTTPDGRILMANPTLVRMLGYSSFEELAQRNLEENGYHPEYPRSAFKQHIESEGQVIGLESAWVKRDGTPLFIRESARAIRDEAGNMLYYEGTVEDITERQQTEIGRERLLTTLEHRNIQLQTAAEVSKSASTILDPEELMKQAVNLIQEHFDLYYVGLFLVDEAGEYAVLRAGTGEAGRQMLAAGHKLAVGGKSMIGWSVANAKARIALDVGKEAIRFDNPYLPETRSEMALPLISRGRWCTGALTVQSTEEAAFSEEDVAILQTMADHLAIANENAWLYDAAQREIAGRRRAELEILKLNVELEQRVIERTAELIAVNKELEAFAYSVSHDLRAPLRGIDGFSKALLEDYADELDADGQDYLRRVRAASQRMGQLIDDLLTLSRVTRAEMRREAIDLSALAQTIAAELQKMQPERQVEFVIAEGLVANGDAHLLRLTLENLLGNAWKFTAKHPRARVEFGVTRIEGESAYFVRDDGAGFDMAYADKLFGVFQRLHSMTEFEGTGIGLATVQRIIHRHGGRVWAEGAVEQGATFYFTL